MPHWRLHYITLSLHNVPCYQSRNYITLSLYNVRCFQTKNYIALSLYNVRCCHTRSYITLSLCNVHCCHTRNSHQPLIARSDWTWAACPVVLARGRTCLCGRRPSGTTWRRSCCSCWCCKNRREGRWALGRGSSPGSPVARPGHHRTCTAFAEIKCKIWGMDFLEPEFRNEMLQAGIPQFF